MAIIYNNANTVNTTSPGFGAVPPMPSSHVFTTNNTSGQFLTSTGSNTVWTTGTSSIPNSEVMRITQGSPPELEVKGRLVLNGQDLEERLKTIETVLQIPERDVILEQKHPKLKKLYDEYIAALGKYRTFEAIKGSNND